MQIIEFNESEKEKYNNAVKNELLQKWEWGDFKKQNNWIPKRLGIADSEKIIYVVQFFIKKLPLGFSFFYAPSVNTPKEKEFKIILEKIKEIARKEKAIFLMVETDKKELLIEYGFKKAGKDIQPKDTLLLDISKNEEEILSQMKQKGRYNIKIAIKKGVVVKEIKTDKDFLDYKKIHQETAKRDKISTRSFSYLKNLFKVLIKENLGTCFIAYHKDKPLAGGIFTFINEKATYLYGASSNEKRNLMAPYLLQWEVIKYAKQRGCLVYDFYGIAPLKSQNHKWLGISDFKAKFGGKRIELSGAYDFSYRPFLYIIFKTLEKIRRIFK